MRSSRCTRCPFCIRRSRRSRRSNSFRHTSARTCTRHRHTPGHHRKHRSLCRTACRIGIWRTRKCLCIARVAPRVLGRRVLGRRDRGRFPRNRRLHTDGPRTRARTRTYRRRSARSAGKVRSSDPSRRLTCTRALPHSHTSNRSRRRRRTPSRTSLCTRGARRRPLALHRAQPRHRVRDHVACRARHCSRQRTARNSSWREPMRGAR